MMARSKAPETVSDFIALFQAVKEKYGDLKVRGVNESYHANDEGEYYDWNDIVVTSAPESLIRNNSEVERYLLFVVD